jgi:hypothetical protein
VERSVSREQASVLVLSDTHVRDDGRPHLPTAVFEAALQADTILHAGDIVSPRLLGDLAALAPTVAVLGNNDHGLDDRLPVRRELSIAGVRIAMVHDAGARQGRATRLNRWFPGASVIVFGHSHDPVNEPGADGQLLLNPGSPTQRRRQPVCTMARLELVAGRVSRCEIVPLAG